MEFTEDAVACINGEAVEVQIFSTRTRPIKRLSLFGSRTEYKDETLIGFKKLVPRYIAGTIECEWVDKMGWISSEDVVKKERAS